MPDENHVIESLRWEYREVASHHRFYVGLRFTIVASVILFHAGLMKFYTDVSENILKARDVAHVRDFWISQENYVPAEVQPILITVVGALTIFTALLMGIRNQNRINVLVGRGA